MLILCICMYVLMHLRVNCLGPSYCNIAKCFDGALALSSVPQSFVFIFLRSEMVHLSGACLHTCNTYIHIPTYKDTLIHTHIYTYIHIHKCIHTYIHRYMRRYMHTCIHTYVHTYIQTDMHAYIHIRAYIHYSIHTYVHTHTYIHAYIHAHVHT